MRSRKNIIFIGKQYIYRPFMAQITCRFADVKRRVATAYPWIDGENTPFLVCEVPFFRSETSLSFYFILFGRVKSKSLKVKKYVFDFY